MRPAERQLIAIARAVAAKSSVLILDEPTSTLSASEAERLFGILKRLRASGIAILYISHRLGDLQRIADRAVVLRGGKVVGEFSQADRFPGGGRRDDRPLARGRLAGRRGGHRHAAVALSLKGVRLIPQSAPFDLDVRLGEVVAITGALGSGKSRLLRGLYGLDDFAGGEVLLDGQPWKSSGPAQSIGNGVYMVAEDRWVSSLMPSTTLSGTIAGTISFPHLKKWFGNGIVRTEPRAPARPSRPSRGLASARADRTTRWKSCPAATSRRWCWRAGRPNRAGCCCSTSRSRASTSAPAPTSSRRYAAARRIPRRLIATSDAEEALEVADRIFVMRDHTLVGSGDARPPRFHSGRARPGRGGRCVGEPSMSEASLDAAGASDRPAPRSSSVARKAGLFVLLAAMIVGFWLAEPAFLNVNNLFSVLQAVAVVAILGVGVTLTLAVDGFDLSIGSIAASAVMAASYAMVVWQFNAYETIPAVLVMGALIGLVNGLLIVRVGIPDLLATLSSMFLLAGLQLIPTGGRSITSGMIMPNGETAPGAYDPAFFPLGRARLWDVVPLPVVIMAVVALVFWFFMERTRWGRVFYAIGGNEMAAHLAGAPTSRYRLDHLCAVGHAGSARRADHRRARRPRRRVERRLAAAR